MAGGAGRGGSLGRPAGLAAAPVDPAPPRLRAPRLAPRRDRLQHPRQPGRVDDVRRHDGHDHGRVAGADGGLRAGGRGAAGGAPRDRAADGLRRCGAAGRRRRRRRRRRRVRSGRPVDDRGGLLLRLLQRPAASPAGRTRRYGLPVHHLPVRRRPAAARAGSEPRRRGRLHPDARHGPPPPLRRRRLLRRRLLRLEQGHRTRRPEPCRRRLPPPAGVCLPALLGGARRADRLGAGAVHGADPGRGRAGCRNASPSRRRPYRLPPWPTGTSASC